MAQEAAATKFKYVFIPCDKSAAATEHQYDGDSDEELRNMIRNYFHNKSRLSEGQRGEFATVLSAKVEDNMAKQQQNAEMLKKATGNDDAEASKVQELDDNGNEKKPEESAAAAPEKKGDEKEARNALLAGAMDSSSFEIVPVTMPTLKTKFIGTSLYIDDAGRFKELPLNDRASQISQRDIRGDAFLLSNHDDPALDEWKRVDTTLAQMDDLIANPPEQQLDTSNQAAMTAAALQRDAITKLVSVEDAAAALAAKKEGNEKFVAKDFTAAIEAYSKAIELSSARTDRLDNEDEVVAARIASYNNRTQCYLNLGNNAAAAKDCVVVLQQDPKNIKAHFRLAKASIAMDEYDTAESSVKQFEKHGGPADQVAEVRAQLEAGKAKFENKQKKIYKKMFA